MEFTGNEGAPIALAQAGEWTKNYRSENPGATQGHFFGRVILEQLLAEGGSKGIRFYYGLDGEGQRQLLAVAADAAQNDLLGDECIIADDSWTTPPYSGIANDLNS